MASWPRLSESSAGPFCISRKEGIDVAEDTGGGANAAVATQDIETTEQGIQQQRETYAPEVLEEILGRAVDARLSLALQQALTPFQRQLDQRFTRIEQLAPRLEELQPQIQEVLGDAKATRRLVKDVLAGRTLDETQLQAIDEAEQLENQQRAEARQQRERAQLQNQVDEARKGQQTPEQRWEQRFNDAWLLVDADLDEVSRGAGFRDFKSISDEVKAAVGLAKPTAGDDLGLKAWKQAATKFIRAKAAARDAEGNASVNVPSQRGGGGQSATQIWESFGQGDVPWSPQVQKAGKELGYI